MKLAIAFLLAACASAPPAPPSNANHCVAVEPSCRTAVEKVRVVASLHARDVTMAIGECDQQEWSIEVRRCVADARVNADLLGCATKFQLPKHGLFREVSSMDAEMKMMSKFRDQMCACRDAACVQQVSDDLTKWGQEMTRDGAQPPKFNEEDTKRLTVIGESMGKCMEKAMGGGTP